MFLNLKNKYIQLPFEWQLELENKTLKILFKEKNINLVYIFPENIEVFIENSRLYFPLKENSKKKQVNLHKVLFFNWLQGKFLKYKKILIISGIGFKFNINSDNIIIYAGFSKPILLNIPNFIQAFLENPNKLILESENKAKLGIFAAFIKSIKPVEIYKLKGIRYENEILKAKNYKKIK